MANRIWIYQSDRILSDQEVEFMERNLMEFCKNWSAHGKNLESSFSIKHNIFLVLMVNEALAEATGCSIDSSVQFIRNLATEINVDFFNRLNTVYEKDHALHIAHSSQLDALYQNGEIHEDTLFINPLIQSEKDFETQWKIPFSKHWSYRQVKQKTTV